MFYRVGGGDELLEVRRYQTMGVCGGPTYSLQLYHAWGTTKRLQVRR